VAAAHQEARRSDEAVARRQQALTDQQQNLGPDHPDTLATRFAIAREMAARGDHAGAEKEFRDVLPHLERKLGRDHPVTLILWFSIARQMAARGNYAGAEGEFLDMLPHLRRKLGPDHPDFLAAADQNYLCRPAWLAYLNNRWKPIYLAAFIFPRNYAALVMKNTPGLMKGQYRSGSEHTHFG
jgi:Tetratricopeptide repeat